MRNESVIVVLKYPTSQQSQQIFRSMESHIKEEISNYNPNFYFSSAVRIGNKLFYKGSKDKGNGVFDSHSEGQTHSIF